MMGLELYLFKMLMELPRKLTSVRLYLQNVCCRSSSKLSFSFSFCTFSFFFSFIVSFVVSVGFNLSTSIYTRFPLGSTSQLLSLQGFRWVQPLNLLLYKVSVGFNLLLYKVSDGFNLSTSFYT